MIRAAEWFLLWRRRWPQHIAAVQLERDKLLSAQEADINGAARYFAFVPILLQNDFGRPKK